MIDTILHGDALAMLATLPDESVHTCVTSPPYWGLRDYGMPGQLGLEETPEEYVARLVAIFREVRRVLRADGTLWLNLGDSYAVDMPRGKGRKSGTHGMCEIDALDKPERRRPQGLKPKDMVGVPWRVAFALQADGWYLRADIIWHKPNAMPESVRDRPTKAHEYVFLLSKSERYYYDADAVREAYSETPGALAWRGIFDTRKQRKEATLKAAGIKGGNDGARTYAAAGRNKRTVWSIATRPYKGAHFAVMPPALVEPCVLAGCPSSGVVLDPFMGAGTVAVTAKRHSRHYLGIELNPAYIALAEERIAAERQPVLWSAARLEAIA